MLAISLGSLYLKINNQLADLRVIAAKLGRQVVRPAFPSEMTTFEDWSGRHLAGKYLVSLNLEATK
jgi:hypothetical protein